MIYDCVVIVSVRGEMLRYLRLCGNSFRKEGRCYVIYDCMIIVSVRGEMLHDRRPYGISFRKRGDVT